MRSNCSPVLVLQNMARKVIQTPRRVTKSYHLKFKFCNFRYGHCHESNLNGFNFGSGTVTPYAVGIVWLPITTFDSSLAKVEMSIKGNTQLEFKLCKLIIFILFSNFK